MTISRSLLVLAASAVLLTGCTTPAAPGSGDAPGGDDSSSVSAKGTKCEDNTSDVTLFSDPSITQSPEYGQVWGDGSPLVIAYGDYTEGTLSYDLSYVQDDGAVIPLTGGFFPDPVDKVFTSNDPFFGSAAEGYYGIADVAITIDTTTTYIGAYCIVLALAE